MSRVFRFTFLISLFVSSAVFGQINNCPTVAVVSPPGDSVLQSMANVSFTSQSINATGYQFIFNNWGLGMNTPLVNMPIESGLTTVQLVAYGQNCNDTSTVYYFYPGQPPSDTDNSRRSYGIQNREHDMRGLLSLKNGDYLMYGHRNASNFWNESQMGLLIRAKDNGCIKWAKKIPNNYFTNSTITAVKESLDSSLYMLVAYSNTTPYLVKLSSTADIIWSKSLKDNLGNYENIVGLEPTTDSGIVVVSTPAQVTSFNVTRLSASGNILWQKHFDYNGLYSSWFKNLLIKDNYLYIGGSVSYNYNGMANYGTFISKMNFISGEQIWTKNYLNGSNAFVIGDLLNADSAIMVSILAGTGNSNRPPVGGVMKIDTSGSIISAFTIADIHVPNPYYGPFVSGFSQMIKSSNNYYIVTPGSNPMNLQGDGSGSFIIRLDSSLQVKWVKHQGGIGLPRYNYVASGINGSLLLGGVEPGPLQNFNNQLKIFTTFPLDTLGGNLNASCYLFDKTWELYYPTFTVSPIQWTLYEPAINTAEDRSPTWANAYPYMRFRCPDYLDSCSFIKITGPSQLCNLSQTYTYKGRRNKTCGRPINWQVPSGVQIVSQTDSTIVVKFLNFGRHVLYGRILLSCVPVEDSIVIDVASGSSILNLGADFQMCPGSTQVLHAGPNFTSYLWQDGSTDSTLTINQPGQYWVSIVDSCNNIFSDTISVNNSSPIPLGVGPDRSICYTDSVHLSASPGFVNYQWSPNYQVNTTVGQTIIATPLIDTTYTVIAELTSGCFAYDTVRVTINHSTPINLGSDVSFCAGDSVILDAGVGLSSYLWNTGSISQRIIVRSIGAYSVIGVNNLGCKSYDTLSVLRVFNLPQPQLNQNLVLCEGKTIELTPGSGFTQYSWNTGATTSYITVSSIGHYSVTVTDANNCSASSSIEISVIQPNPATFLGPDISLCYYEKETLMPLRPYPKYLWSTGHTTSSITVKDPGIYWLQVTDHNGCVGNDTLLIKEKSDCIYGVHLPNAFTPNNDGKNDLFKPLLFGSLLEYDFIIFNRWGEIVFKSRTPSEGWNGQYRGTPQDSGMYIWTINYKLEGEQAKKQQGTVLLIR